MDARTTWPALLNALLAGENLDGRRDRLGDERDHVRRGDPRADRRLRRGAARQGRDGRGGDGPRRARCSSAPPRCRWTGPIGRRRRHRRRPGPHRQRLDHGRDRRRRRRGAGWSSTATGPAVLACGAADVLEHLGVVLDLPPGATAQVADEVGIAFCFAPVYHPALRFAGPAAQGARHPDGLQLPRPADQPGPARRPGDRGLRPADGCRWWRASSPSGACRRWCSAATTGSTSSPPPTTSTVWVVRDGTATRDALRPGRRSASPRARPADLRGGDVAFNAGSPATCSPASPARCATRCCSTRRPRWSPPTARRRTISTAAMRAGYDRAAQAVDSGAAAAVLDRWIEFSRPLAVLTAVRLARAVRSGFRRDVAR